jgi:heat shock protein HslJ
MGADMARRTNRARTPWLASTLLLAVLVEGAMAQSLEGTAWNAVEVYGTAVTALSAAADRQPHLVFGLDGRVAGADGCNQLSGSYTVKGEAISFGEMRGTLMACPKTEELTQRFRAALKGTGHWRIIDGRLQFYGATGKPLAVFEPRSPAGSGGGALQGTSWQLVKFQGGDGQTFTPGAAARYTIEFAADGALIARIDCNRGRGTWQATPLGQLELGPLALTRARCPEGSLHDQIVRQWTFVRSFLVKDGHLFLSLMADGGTYEFAPVAPKKP